MSNAPITIITGANSATIAMWSVTRAHKLHQIEFKPAGANLYCTPVKFAVQSDCRSPAKYFSGGTTVNPGGLQYKKASGGAEGQGRGSGYGSGEVRKFVAFMDR